MFEESRMLTNDIASYREAAEAIIKDLESRKGIGDEWNDLDDDIRDEIIEKWSDILMDHL